MTEVENKLRKLLQDGVETEIVEFKEAKNSYDFTKIGKYFSALSNEANLRGSSSAWLIFGIRDKDKAFVNTRYRMQEKDRLSLKKEIADKTNNRITFIDIYELNLPEGRVLIFDIPPAPRGIPVAWQGHYYGRDGESLGALNIEEIDRIRSQAHQQDWSANIVQQATLEDLSPEAIRTARELYTRKHKKFENDVPKWDNSTFLNKAKLTIKGQVTNAALLLLGKPESEHLLSPSTSQITWILKDKDNTAKDYAHFYCPLLLSADDVRKKIRNLKYRYLLSNTLFPEEVDQYDPYIIREALNNAIAHQDYTLGRRIVVVENEAGQLLFSNAGSFLPPSVESVVVSNAPEYLYRNKFLVTAMVNLDMIDTIGSGIRKMFFIQKRKYFPLPDYDLSDDTVRVTITGSITNSHYAQQLATVGDLSLENIMLLDRVAKRKPITKQEAEQLRSKKLIEGRRPNYRITDTIARATGEKAKYIKEKGLNDQYYSNLILQYLNKFNRAESRDIRRFIFDKLPDILDNQQKKNKLKNLLQKMKKKGLIRAEGKSWCLDEV